MLQRIYYIFGSLIVQSPSWIHIFIQYLWVLLQKPLDSIQGPTLAHLCYLPLQLVRHLVTSGERVRSDNRTYSRKRRRSFIVSPKVAQKKYINSPLAYMSPNAFLTSGNARVYCIIKVVWIPCQISPSESEHEPTRELIIEKKTWAGQCMVTQLFLLRPAKSPPRMSVVQNDVYFFTIWCTRGGGRHSVHHRSLSWERQ